MLTKLNIYFFNEIEMFFTVRGKHHQARLTEGISNAKLMTITFNNTPDKDRWTQFRSNFIQENCVDISR